MKRGMIIGIACLAAIGGITYYGANDGQPFKNATNGENRAYKKGETEILIRHLWCLYNEYETPGKDYSIYSPPAGAEYFSFQIGDFNGDYKNELLVYLAANQPEDNYFMMYSVDKDGFIETQKGQFNELVTNTEALDTPTYNFRYDHIKLCEQRYNVVI